MKRPGKERSQSIRRFGNFANEVPLSFWNKAEDILDWLGHDNQREIPTQNGKGIMFLYGNEKVVMVMKGSQNGF